MKIIMIINKLKKNKCKNKIKDIVNKKNKRQMI